MSIKMSLDVPAMERLFKDDKELEVQLKHGVMMNFVDKYMRVLLKDEFLQKEITTLRKALADSIDEKVGDQIGKLKNEWGGSVLTLNSKFKEQLTANIGREIDSKVYEIIGQKIEAAMKGLDIERIVKVTVDSRIKQIAKTEIEQKVREAFAVAFSK